MDNNLYPFSPIVSRPKLVWPGDARLAVYVGLNLEHFHVDRPSTSIWPGTAHLQPDPLNHGWRDYGARVGLWRLIEIFDRHGVRPSALVNSEVVERYPEILQAGLAHDWAWVAHGRTNSQLHSGFTPEEEQRELAEILGAIARATGRAPQGWMGPGLTETYDTPRLLKALGASYVLDWTADDQPFPLSVPGMISVPYSVELNDIMLFVTKSFTGEEFYQAVVDQFDQLYADAKDSARVMALVVHPYIMGAPHRLKYYRKALEHVLKKRDVLVWTGEQIAEWFVAKQQR